MTTKRKRKRPTRTQREAIRILKSANVRAAATTRKGTK